MQTYFDIGPVLFGTEPETVPVLNSYPVSVCVPIHGISLVNLQDAGVLVRQDWYLQFGWAVETVPPGVYGLRLSQQSGSYIRQACQRLPGEGLAPIALTVACLLCAQRRGVLEEWGPIWCREGAGRGHRAMLSRLHGQLSVGKVWDDAESEDFRAVFATLR